MTIRRRLWLQMLVLLTLLSGSARLGAQDYGLSVTSQPGTPVANSPMTFLLTLTNTAEVALTNITVVNTLPPSFTFLSSTQAFGGVTVNGRIATFTLDWLFTNEVTHLAIIARPTTFVTFLNQTVVANTNSTPVTNIHGFTVYSAAADLAVGLSGFASGVLSNDLTSYTLSATNLGPSAAPNVVISNFLPAGVQFAGIAPSNAMVSFTSNLLTIRLTSFNSGAVTNYRVNVQPASAGTFEFAAGISAPGLFDVNPTNNAATGSLTVGDFPAGTLVATVLSAQVYNPQTGLMEQTIELANLGESAVDSARVVVQGLTNWLYNAVGTNNGSPFVVHAQALAPGESVELLLEYFVPTRLPVPDPTLLAVAVPVFDPTGPMGSPPEIKQLVYAPGRILVEFDSVAGRTYTVLYSADATFTTVYAAQPPVTATANRTQWIDSGPPKTISVPGAARYYRVIQNP